ncbi:Phosphatidylserine/phosphatidylglycerophosphate/cardiolipin synthase [Cupriavidus necator]|uniref:phospholipase D n=1 Tax=Cupriavidus necator (strain ATCC 17699 / DSM 428 / KCTC 22496 / NCIMB 10442 / H16 / Stanier 337) TaxID=381666 RepID=A0AAF1D4W3_CUPNH|nr:phospholipase [Cupriavidus necator]QCC05127.1 phospholipase D family protein [Cupriavidus necator H16]QQB81083.1 phospholipase D family protein [Cupriavidus necator]
MRRAARACRHSPTQRSAVTYRFIRRAVLGLGLAAAVSAFTSFSPFALLAHARSASTFDQVTDTIANSISETFNEAVANHFPARTGKPAQPPDAKPVPAKPFADGSGYTLCFVPDGASCQALLINAIRSTRHRLLIQAYSFTSAPIAEAVAQAHRRGVDVRVILDKSQQSERYTSATYLKHAGVPVVIDNKPAIAHNKVMVFDDQAVFTGSFNFTKSAQERNAENGMLIRGDAAVVRAYTDNWNKRYQQSRAY